MTTKHLPLWARRKAQRRSTLPQSSISPENSARIAKIRAEAAEPGTLVVVVPGNAGSVAISPDEIVARSDDELLAFIAVRLGE